MVRSSKTATAKEKSSVEDIVVKRLIQKFEGTGKLFWQCGYNPSMIQPKNFYTNNAYSGVNIMLLWGGSGRFITATQLKLYNKENNTEFWFPKGVVKDTVIFAKETKTEISDAKAQELTSQGKGRFIRKIDGKLYQVYIGHRYHEVIDCALITNPEGVPLYNPPAPPVVATSQVTEQAKLFVNKYMQGSGVSFNTHNATPCYREADDSINIPPLTSYRNDEAFYRDVLHELVHSTGVARRLNRPEYSAYHQLRTQRSREEFVAEVGSMLLTASVGYNPEGAEADNSANYVLSWCKWFKENPKELFQGLAESQRAVAYMQEVAAKGSEQAATVNPPGGDQLPTTMQELADHLSELAERNNNRGKRTWDRLVKHEKLLDGLVLKFNKKGTISRSIPLFIIDMPNNAAIWVGMSFAIYRATDGKASVLYSIERGSTIEQAAQVANQLKHEGFKELVSYMNLRNRIQ